MQYEDLNQKQGRLFLLDKLYPQYFKPSPQRSQSQCLERRQNIARAKENKKIQSKLKMIVYNLQRQIQEQSITKNKLGYRRDSQYSKLPAKSISLQSLNRKAYSERYHTQLQQNQMGDYSERSQIINKIKLKELNKKKKQQTQALILPKLKLNNKRHEHSRSKDILKKRYKLSEMEKKQQQLGKLVLQKVEKHFALEKASNKHYYEKIKSEQSIDESLVTFLKNKVNKANLSINNN